MGSRCQLNFSLVKEERDHYSKKAFAETVHPLLQYQCAFWVHNIPRECSVLYHVTGLNCFSAGHITFVPFNWKPTISCPIYSSAPASYFKCFMGQLPNDNIAHCQWLMTTFCHHVDPHATLCNISPHLAGPHNAYNGCAHVMLYSSYPEVVMACLHKRVLFDREGVWYAKDELGMAFLQAYGEHIRMLPQKDRHALLPHLPHQPLTFEPQRRF